MATTARISTEIGMGTGGGMLIGGLAGGGKGFLIGGAIGATVTVAHWLGKHRSAMLPAGTEPGDGIEPADDNDHGRSQQWPIARLRQTDTTTDGDRIVSGPVRNVLACCYG
jgi:hypothetical protein